MRVLIQMQSMPELRAAMTAESFTMTTEAVSIDGFSLDQGYTPVLVPNRQRRDEVGAREVGRLFSFDARPEVSTYLVRGEVADESLESLKAAVEQDPNAVAVFSDPRISGIFTCPFNTPVGNHRDVENLLQLPQLQAEEMDGSNVMVAIVDSGVNLAHLQSKGKTPQFDANKSWTPISGLTPGNMPVGHGTMCAFDACIAAPNSTILDYALLQSQAEGGSVMDGFLSDAVRAFSNLLQILSAAPEPKPALVVNNSWAMFHPSWDFPVGDPSNYSDNPNHPFNIIVESLEDAGADILFAAGNCGASECTDRRCQGVTNRTIYGANSNPSVLSIAGVTVNKERLGYSSTGPGRLDSQKPDLSAYTHFDGSGVYAADSGTSAACPVAAGVVAAIRTKYPTSVLSPANLRQLLRRTAEDLSPIGFDYEHGFGLIDVPAILNALKGIVPELPIGEVVSEHLNQTGDSTTYRVMVGTPLSLELDGEDGVDFDLYVRKTLQPTISEFDYRGYSSLPDEKISIRPSEPGKYFVMVHSYRGAGDFTLKATVE